MTDWICHRCGKELGFVGMFDGEHTYCSDCFYALYPHLNQQVRLIQASLFPEGETLVKTCAYCGKTGTRLIEEFCLECLQDEFDLLVTELLVGLALYDTFFRIVAESDGDLPFIYSEFLETLKNSQKDAPLHYQNGSPWDDCPKDVLTYVSLDTVVEQFIDEMPDDHPAVAAWKQYQENAVS